MATSAPAAVRDTGATGWILPWPDGVIVNQLLLPKRRVLRKLTRFGVAAGVGENGRELLANQGASHAYKQNEL